jgi:hypothetical protein
MPPVAPKTVTFIPAASQVFRTTREDMVHRYGRQWTMLPPDGHVHSEWSWDAAKGSMERTCARAVEIGLPSIAFTEHADFTPWTVLADKVPPRLRADVSPDGVLVPPVLDLEGYLECLHQCRDRFPDLRILSGVELSEPHWHSHRAHGFRPGRHPHDLWMRA